MVIFPDFYSHSAIKGKSNPFLGKNSHTEGVNGSLIIVFKSQLSTSKSFKVLSTPTVQRVS